MSDASVRTQVILAAIAASGERDEAWMSRVISNTRDIALLTSERSDLAKLVDNLLDPGVKVFPGTVVGVKREAASTRAVVFLDTGTDHVIKGNKRVPINPFTKEPVEEGIEFVRTDRTDTELGLSLARQVKALKGHRVLVFMKMEEMSNGNKVRTLIGLVDQGADPNYASGK